MQRALTMEDRIVRAIRKVIRAVDLQSRRLVDECGLTGPQLAALKEIARLNDTSIGNLARAVHLSQATLTGIIDRLEKRALITRTRNDQDRRSVHVRLAPAGRELLESNPSLLQDHFRENLRKLEDWELTMILATLERIGTLLEAEAGELPRLPGATDANGDGQVLRDRDQDPATVRDED